MYSFQRTKRQKTTHGKNFQITLKHTNKFSKLWKAEFWFPKDSHALVLGTFAYVTSHGKMDFADVIKDKDLEKEILSWIVSVGSV